MFRYLNKTILSMAIAIFSMFFGAGNAVFPPLLGMQTQGQFHWAFLGLMITAIGGPLLGLLGATLYHGRCIPFFSRLGKGPGLFFVVITMGLLGPFAVMPRCVTVAHAAVESLVPLSLFSIVFCGLAFICCWKRKFFLPILGYFLSPLLIGCLLLIIYQGFNVNVSLAESAFTSWKAFKLGISTGYDTMDLIASIYFSAGIWTMIEIHYSDKPKIILKTTLIAGGIGCVLLGGIYLGLMHAAARFAPMLVNIAPEQIMTHLATIALGPTLGMVANLAIALACLTTVISLMMTLSNILCKEIFPQKLTYDRALIANLLFTMVMANLGFAMIMKIIHPIVSICYPIIIVLTVVNIVRKLRPVYNMESKT